MSRYLVHCPLNFAKKQLNIYHHVCLNFSQNCLCHWHCLWHPIAISQKCEGGMRMSNWACSIRASPAVSKTLMRARMKLLKCKSSKLRTKVLLFKVKDESISRRGRWWKYCWSSGQRSFSLGRQSRTPIVNLEPTIVNFKFGILVHKYYNMYNITLWTNHPLHQQ